MTVAWFKGQDRLFTVDVFLVEEDYTSGWRSDALDKSASWRQQLKHFADKKEPVGICFLPLAASLSRSFRPVSSLEEYCIFLAAAGLVPEDIPHVMIFDAVHVGKMDIRRKALAYSPHNRVLFDADEHTEALFDTKKFTDSKFLNQLRLPEEPLPSADKDLLDAISALEVLFEIRNLACRIMGYNESIFSPVDTSSYAISDPNMAIRYVAKVRKIAELFSMMGYEKWRLPFDDMDDMQISELVFRASALHSYSVREDKGVLGKENWQLVNTFEKIEWNYPFGEKDRAFVKDLRKSANTVRNIRTIWNKILSAEKSVLLFPDNIKTLPKDEHRRSLAVRAVQALGEVYGVDSTLAAYASGVPYDDLFT